jgi:CheY-like chemotaxis protein
VIAFLFFFWLIRYLLKPSGTVIDRIKEHTVPLILGTCAAILTFYVVEQRLLVEPGIHAELVKTIIQFLFLILLGGAVTTMHQARLHGRAEEERGRADRAVITERDRLLLLAMHDNLVSAYSRAKRVRRLLRARLEFPDGDTGPCYVLKSVYNEQMEQLIDAELEFEAILRQIASNVPLFGKDCRLDGCLDDIEKSLTETVKEFRMELRNFKGTPARMNLEKLPELESFLGLEQGDGSVENPPDGVSKRRFKEQFRTAIQYLNREINKRARRVNRTGSLLWVDDKPASNRYTVGRLEEEGYEVTIARSTGEAEVHLNGGFRPMLIISDMRRFEDGKLNPEAGLDMLKRLGEGIPVYFYGSYESVIEYREEVERAGGKGITDSRLQLFSFIEKCADDVERIDQPVAGAETTV